MRSSIKTNLFARYFNEFFDHGETFEKRSIHKDKLKQEFQFFVDLPIEMIPYYPKVSDFHETKDFSSYKIEKIPTQDASLWLIDSEDHDEKISQLLKRIEIYFQHVPKIDSELNDYLQVVRREITDKNLKRLEEIKRLTIQSKLDDYAQAFGFKNLEHYFIQLNEQILFHFQREQQHQLYFSHGDMCFSNILPTANHFYLIDPKGASSRDFNLRPIHYDLAKLSQCLNGHYDLINHGLFEIDEFQLKFKRLLWQRPLTQDYFSHLLIHFGTNLRLIRLLEASLLASLLPFHQESEQKVCGFFLQSLLVSRDHL